MRNLWGRLTGRPPKGFARGDKVSWGGAIGTIISLNGSPKAPLQVLFMGPKTIVGFLLDGKFQPWHKARSLKFLMRPKVKIKLTVEDKAEEIPMVINSGEGTQ